MIAKTRAGMSGASLYCKAPGDLRNRAAQEIDRPM
jgi:hypothetical protein